jgi:D-tyrosyl-tRNA(Tyr) deacylase
MGDATIGWVRAVIQRVSRAEVRVGGESVGRIGPGLVVLVGVADTDDEADAAALAAKLVGIRVFRDENGLMNRDVTEVGGEVMVVSQFTLLGDARRGRRPSFTEAARPERAEPLVLGVAEAVAAAGVGVATGRFGAMMEVELVNDGPVTLVIEVIGGRVT